MIMSTEPSHNNTIPRTYHGMTKLCHPNKGGGGGRNKGGQVEEIREGGGWSEIKEGEQYGRFKGDGK